MTDRLLPTVARLRDFIESKSPFYEPHALDLTLDEDAYRAYRANWLAEREFFTAHTGQANASWNCLAPWVRQNEEELLALPQATRSSLAVWAAGTFQDSLVDVLLSNDPKLALLADEHGDLPLHAAAASQSALLFPRLLTNAHGGALHALNGEGKTPIQVLIVARDRSESDRWPVRFGQGKHTHCLRSVAEWAPELLTRSFHDGSTALHLAAALSQPVSACKIIVAAGGAWNQPNAEGLTPAQVLEANERFRPNPASKNPERRREARFREAALLEGQVARPVQRGAGPAAKKRGFFDFLKPKG